MRRRTLEAWMCILTDPSVDLTNSSPTFSGVAGGTTAVQLRHDQQRHLSYSGHGRKAVRPTYAWIV